MASSAFWAVLASCCLLGGAAQARDLTIGMQLEPPHLDPTSGAAGAIDQVFYSNVYEGLTRFAQDGSILPGLAESWQISEDGLSYAFRLRAGVRFHDGSDFEASDVVFTLDRARAPESETAQAALFERIRTVSASEDGLSVQITLSQPDGDFLAKLAWGDAVIVAPETARRLKSRPVGTGPFRFSDWRKGQSISLERNSEYWGEGPDLERAEFRFLTEPEAAFDALMSGAIDAYSGYPAPEHLAEFEADARFDVLEGTTEGETLLAINNAVPPFDDRRVRKAISHAIDRAALIESGMFGYGTPIGTHFPPHHPAYVDLRAISEHDLTEARALLAEAGYEAGFATTLKLPPPAYARRSGALIAEALREIGIETEISLLEWPQWLEQVFNGHDYGLTVISHTEPMDFGIYGRSDYYFQYDNPDLQILLSDLASEADPQNRRALYQKIQRIISADFVNAFLFQLPQITVQRKGLVGLWRDAPTQAIDLTGVSWAE